MRRMLAVVLGVLAGSALFPASALGASPTASVLGASPPATAFGFGYDSLGRLVEAGDPSSNSATYQWDAVGNLKAISHSSSSTVAVTQLTPGSARAGAKVWVYGTGFSATASQDSVAFNGKAASVVSATATQLVVTVPSGATSGRVKVTAPGGSATSASSFTVLGGGAPAITGESFSGNTMTVSGSNFDPTAANDAVLFGQTRLAVTAASSSSLTASFPSTFGGGQVQVGTKTGVATGGDYCNTFGYSYDQCSSVSVGTPAQVTINTAGHVAELVFDGKAGERIFVDVTKSTLSGGSIILSDAYGTYQLGNEPWGYLDTTTLPTTGTYELILAPSNTGTATVTDAPADASYQVTPTQAGSAVNVSTKMGQSASVTFQGSSGQRVYIEASGWVYSGDVGADLYLPDSTTWASGTWVGNGSYVSGDEASLPQDGTYTLRLSPQGPAAGSMTVTFYLVPADAAYQVTPSQSGAQVNVATGTPGQNAAVTFQETAGDRIFVLASNWTYPGQVTVYVHNPDGSTWVSGPWNGSGSTIDSEEATLPQTGTYTLLLDTQGAGTGGMTLTFYQVPPDPESQISIGGSPVQLTTTTPGQNGWLYFSGSSGQAIHLSASNVTIANSQVTIYNPDNSQLTTGSITTSGGMLSATLSQTGTYWVFVDPQGTATGNMTLTLTDPPATPGQIREKPQPRTGTGPGSLSESRALALGAVQPMRAPAGPGVGSPPIQAHLAPEARSLAGPAAARLRGHSPLVSFKASASALWTPSGRNLRGDWEIRSETSPWTRLVPRTAPGHGTELAGQALQLNGMPLAGVRVSIAGSRAQGRTDQTGRFLLTNLPAGHQVLDVDGTEAGGKGQEFGSFQIGVDLRQNRETVLAFTLWLPELDRANAVPVSSPTTRAITLRTPLIPGLEVKIPAGSTITGLNGKPVSQLSIVPVPVDRPPFPLPLGSYFPVYLSVQPSGAYVSGGAEIIYPNYSHIPAGQRVPFWNYDPSNRGWYIYGQGTVSKNGQQIIPDPGTRVWQFTGAMVAGSEIPPAMANTSEEPSVSGADPVNLSSGLFTYQKTDLELPDVLPIADTRVYRPADNNSYSFGIGTASIYDMRLFSQNNYYSAELILPDGMDIHYNCVANCSSTWNAQEVYDAQNTPTQFDGSQITVDQVTGGNGGWFALRLRNGLTYFFSEELQFGLEGIRDRFGNEITIARNAAGDATQVTSPNGRWIDFQYDANNRITQATDSAGRVVKYSYDSTGRLHQVTDANGGVTTYTYDPSSGWMTQVTDARGYPLVTNVYDANGRVTQQTIGTESTPYKFSYVLNSGGQVTQSTMTSPNGNQTVTNLDASGFPTSQTLAAGTSLAETTTYQRQAGTELITSETDQLGRTTSFGYDAHGNLSSITEDATGSNPRTTSIVYDPTFSQPTQVTDPLGKVTKYGYDSRGELTTITDPLGNQTTIGYANQNGQPTSITDPLQNETTYGYQFGDLTTITDPDGNTTSGYLDAGGRLVSSTDALGNTTTYAYDPLNDLTSITDPLGQQTTYTYDADGDLHTIKDANQNTTTLGYDNQDRLTSSQDALGNVWNYSYDNDNNLTGITDPNGQTITYQPDALDRVASAIYMAAGGSTQSTIDYTYDLGNRLTKAVDSTGGTFNESWDNFDELTQESGPNGTIAYTYDADGRSQTATVSGQPQVTYGYDDDSRLTSISNGTQTVSLAYDNASRPQKTTLPNGISENYTYDPASQLTDILYDNSTGTQIGDLHYAYDPAGDRTAEWGSFARITIPQAWGPATYNADNQLTSLAGASYSYDANGNLTGDGTNTYSWNARNQLTGISGATTASYTYDPFGRREQQTVNGTTTSYLYDGQNVAQDLSNGTPQTNYLLGPAPEQLYSRTDANGTQSYLTDALGSTLALANSDQSLPTTYTYDPSGQTTVTGTASSNPYQYAGGQTDSTGLQYNLARYYNPSQTRFISQDPLGYTASGPDLYQYANDNPTNYTDPTGQDSTPDTLATLALGAASTLSGGKDNASSGPASGESTGSAPDAQAGPPDDWSAEYQPGQEPGQAGAAAEDAGSEGDTFLYQKLSSTGEHLKYGITQNPETRYTPAELNGGWLKILAQGSKEEMLALERSLHETLPIGPEEGQTFYIRIQVAKGLRPPPY